MSRGRALEAARWRAALVLVGGPVAIRGHWKLERRNGPFSLNLSFRLPLFLLHVLFSPTSWWLARHPIFRPPSWHHMDD